jgi:hypothetical protein
MAGKFEMAARYEFSIFSQFKSKSFQTLDLKILFHKENIVEVTFFQNFKMEE